MSNVYIHLYEQAGQTLGVDGDASWPEIELAFQGVADPSPTQRMAAEILLSTPPLVRRLILDEIRKERARKDNMAKLLAAVPNDAPDESEADKDKWKKNQKKQWKRLAQLEESTIAKKKGNGCLTIHFYDRLIHFFHYRSMRIPNRVRINAGGSPLFYALLPFLGLAGPDGREEGDKKVEGIELTPYPRFSQKDLHFEARVTRRGRGWNRVTNFFPLPEKSWADHVLSGILRQIPDKDLTNWWRREDEWEINLIYAHLSDLAGERDFYPQTIKEIARIINRIVDPATVRKAKAAERQRRWRAENPNSQKKEERNAYMRKYREANRENSREKQREYTRNWREKRKQA